MSSIPKEGGTRPLCESAPVLPPQAAPVYSALPAPAPAPLPAAFVWAALWSYLPAWLYVRYILFAGTWPGWGMPLFTALHIAAVDILAGTMRRKGSRESVFWAVCWAVLGVGMAVYGAQPGGLGLWQMLAWHAFAVWYTLARCGMLAAGQSGILLWLDGIAGFFTLPFGNFFLRVRALWQGARGLVRRRAKGGPGAKKRAAVVLGSAALALVLCAVAWGQLCAADENFARLGGALFAWPRWDFGWDIVEWLFYFVPSLPVGAWLYGLAAGGLKREAAPVTAQKFYAWLAPLQKLPPLTVYLTLGALCGVYALFFGVQAYTFGSTALAAGTLALTGAQASRFAVNGFWELCRVLLLNFAVLGGIRFLGPQLRQRRPVKALCAVYCVFGLGFAALAAAKLGAYVRLYGYTPRRVISGWFLCVLGVWALLALLWVLGVRVPFGHARLGVYVFAAAFVALAAVNMRQRIVRADIGRWASGTDAALATDALAACGVGTAGWGTAADGEQALYARWLLEAGWFDGRTPQEIGALYYLAPAEDGGTWVADAPLQGDTVLRLTFTDGLCTAAALAPRETEAAGTIG